jgi:hypothetical protein
MIDVAERDLKTILALLDKHVPECEVRAFGSGWHGLQRITLTLIWLLLDPRNLQRGQLDDLKEALAESSVPFRVDVMDWHRISEQFHRNIEKNFKVIKSSVVKRHPAGHLIKFPSLLRSSAGERPRQELLNTGMETSRG